MNVIAANKLICKDRRWWCIPSLVYFRKDGFELCVCLYILIIYGVFKVSTSSKETNGTIV